MQDVFTEFIVFLCVEVLYRFGENPSEAVARESVRVPYPHCVSFINFVIVQVKVEEKKVKLKRFEKKELNFT